MSLGKAIISGLVGAATVTLLNESVRQFVKDAPRLDVLGKRAVGIPLMKSGIEPPKGEDLYWMTMAGDIVLNSFYYSLVGLSDAENSLKSGMLLGMAAGVGAVFQGGLDWETSQQREQNRRS